MSDQKHLVETFHFLLNCKDFEFICLILFLFLFPHLLLSSFPLLLQVWWAAQAGGGSSLCWGIGWRGCQANPTQTLSTSRDGGCEEGGWKGGEWTDGGGGREGARTRGQSMSHHKEAAARVRGRAGGQEKPQVEWFSSRSPDSPDESANFRFYFVYWKTI